MKRTFFLLTILLLAACSKLTVENYDKLKAGMSYDDVTGLLGKPASCSDALLVRVCQWREGERSISVSFVDGKATLFSADKIK